MIKLLWEVATELTMFLTFFLICHMLVIDGCYTLYTDNDPFNEV